MQPDIQTEIEAAFKTPVHQIYQGSEGSIALTCKYGSLHINEDLIKLQLNNQDGSETESGQPCFQSIVTDLHKKSQPIIRYELNDIITISPEKCHCGSNFRVIEQIMGRADDLFWAYGVNTNELQYIFPDYIRRAIINSNNNINEYQAIQKKYDKVIVRVEMKSENFNKESVTNQLKLALQKVFNSHRCIIPEIEIRFEKPVRNPESKKLVRISREFSIEN